MKSEDNERVPPARCHAQNRSHAAVTPKDFVHRSCHSPRDFRPSKLVVNYFWLESFLLDSLNGFDLLVLLNEYLARRLLLYIIH